MYVKACERIAINQSHLAELIIGVTLPDISSDKERHSNYKMCDNVDIFKRKRKKKHAKFRFE